MVLMICRATGGAAHPDPPITPMAQRTGQAFLPEHRKLERVIFMRQGKGGAAQRCIGSSRASRSMVVTNRSISAAVVDRPTDTRMP